MSDEEFQAVLLSLQTYVYDLAPDVRIAPFFFAGKTVLSPQDIVKEVESKSSMGMAYARQWKELRGDKL